MPMEADWDEITRFAVPSTGPLGIASPATALVFDDQQELLWIGTDQGRVISYHGPELSRYTSIKAHGVEGPVRQLLVCDRGIVSLSARSVHLINRRGLTQWHATHPAMTELRCMSFTTDSSQLMVAGCQPTFLIVDMEKGEVLSQYPAQAKYTLMKKSRHICAATDDGFVHVINARDYQVLKRWKAHARAVNDMDARNDFLVTCGFSVRQMGVPIVDPLANVYDLKNLKPLPPIPFHAGAAYVRLHPKLSTTSFVSSQAGQMQVVDLMNPINVMLRQANVQFMLSMEVASSGDALAFTDTNGLVYLWGSPARIKFNNISKETEFGQPLPTNLPHVDWQDAPLNTIGMPYYSERLLSAWPSNMTFEVGAPPPVLDPALVQLAQPAELGHYMRHVNPKKLVRYQVEDTRLHDNPAILATPKFLSEKAREAGSQEGENGVDHTKSGVGGATSNGRAQTEKERMLKYSSVEIKYSKFGVDDFDFRYYNKTPYSGLETHIRNSYLNSLLQLYRFVPLVRNLALQHTASACVAPNCLLCEFGFLFDMLEKAAGQNCQATNLLRTFGSLREVATLNLTEKSALLNHVALSNTIQGVNRFMLKQIAQDFTAMAGSSDGADDILSTRATEMIRCMYCGNETTKSGALHVHDLLYPNFDPKHNPRNPVFSFSSILKATLEREIRHRGWCNKCRRYQQLATRKSTQQLPFVLMLNAALANPAMGALWETTGWLPTEIGITLQNRNVYVFQGPELAAQLRTKSSNVTVYELTGFVTDIDTSNGQQPHLVGMINVDASLPRPTSVVNGKTFPDWHLFNDFLVSAVDPREALHFDKTWKQPCVLAWQVKSAHGHIDNTWRETMDTTLLHQHYSINGIAGIPGCEPLTAEERPRPGTIVALDTEFVELEKAEIDVKADGTHETIRPAKNGLARVSVLRGEGEREAKPFVDDYITIFEPVVDYKTQYSGIKPGDLDVRMSRHNLVPLKVAYKKLWLLLNLGCSFVGHGLASDFRKANIHVPKAQTIDTQTLYLLPGKNRRFSLRYLAWAIFKEHIQEEVTDENQVDGHDSIEDAHMALRLWRKFQEYEDAGIVEQMIEDIYRKGSRFGWKPPNRSMGVAGYLVDGALTGSAVPSGRNTPSTPIPNPDSGNSVHGGPLTPARSVFSSPTMRFSAANMASNTSLSSNGGLGESPLR